MSFTKIYQFTLLSVCLSFSAFGQSTDSTAVNKEVPKIVLTVNQEKSTEFSPTISADGKTLIFESDRVDEKWMLFQSQMNDEGAWSDPAPIDSINNACDFIGGPNLSFDGNTLYYTAYIEGETQTEDIYFSSLVSGGWSAPKRFMGTVNTDEGYEGFSSIASDERSIYFISVNEDYPYDKKNKENCFKILVSTKSIQGEWSIPDPLPELINSGCVRDPKIMADNRTLLFSALTAGEKGKFNMYQSQIQIDGNWGEPVPLDYVNTELNNLAPAIPASGDIMYFNSEGNIYTIGIAPEYRQFFNASIVGHIRDFKTGEGMAAKIIIKDANNLEVISVLNSNERGRFNIILNGGRNYKVEFEMDDYLSQSFDYPLYYATEYVEEVKTVKLRSDADLGLIVYDKGLNTAMPATISIFEGDSLTSTLELTDYETSEMNLQLDVNKIYSIVASANLFDGDSIEVNTSENTSVNLKFYLAPKTVAYNFKVKDVTSKRRLKSKLTLKNKNKDEIIDGYADETFNLRQGDQYEVLTSGDRGYLLSSMAIDVPVLEDDVEGVYSPAMNMEMEVTPLAVGVSLVLNSISFETNSAQLSAESLLEVDRVHDFMSLNENISIEISAHSDDVGGDNFNLELSKKRAASVEDYLVQKNIPISRMQSVGYGEQKPIVANDSEENRAKNRRVELQVIKVE
jgi:outer membrane protein OmpA-like peptidoglycan-associated protein